MKLHYIKPMIEIIYIGTCENILINHSEPEITSNIGVNENNTFEETDEDVNMTNKSLWE